MNVLTINKSNKCTPWCTIYDMYLLLHDILVMINYLSFTFWNKFEWKLYVSSEKYLDAWDGSCAEVIQDEYQQLPPAKKLLMWWWRWKALENITEMICDDIITDVGPRDICIRLLIAIPDTVKPRIILLATPNISVITTVAVSSHIKSLQLLGSTSWIDSENRQIPYPVSALW